MTWISLSNPRIEPSGLQYFESLALNYSNFEQENSNAVCIIEFQSKMANRESESGTNAQLLNDLLIKVRSFGPRSALIKTGSLF